MGGPCDGVAARMCDPSTPFFGGRHLPHVALPGLLRPRWPARPTAGASAAAAGTGESVVEEVLEVGGDGVVELGIHCGVHVECLGEGRGDEHLRRGWG